MLPLKTAALSALLVLAMAGCQTDTSGGGTTTTATSKGGGKSVVLFKASGRDITAEEFLSSPPIRKSVQQYLLYDAMKSACSKENIKVDEAALEQRVNDAKQGAQMQGMSWEDYLKQTGVTEEEYRDMLKGPMLFEALMTARVKVSEEDLKKAWDTEKDVIVNAYIMENHLPDSDKDKITYDQTKEFSRKRIIGIKGQMDQDKILQDLINETTLDLSPVFKDKEKAKLMEDLILNNSKKEEEKTEDKGEGVALGSASGAAAGGSDAEAPAEGDKAAEGGAAEGGEKAGDGAAEAGK